MANFPLLSMEQNNPSLWAAQKVNDLLKSMSENRYYGENIRSEITNRNQHSKLLGEQAQWYGPKSQAEIDLINKGYIPHYLAQNRLIDQGHIPHLNAQNRLLNEQAQEVGFGNKFKGLSWKEYKTLEDEYAALNGGTGQQWQPSQNNGNYNYPTNMPSLNAQDVSHIDDALKRSYTGLPGQINPSDFSKLSAALGAKQEQPYTAVPQRVSDFNQQMEAPQQQGTPQYLGEANQQLESEPAMQQQQPFDKEKRMAEIRARQREILGNAGKGGKAVAETPEEKRQGQISVAQEKENIKEAAKDAEKAELASEASQVAEGALNKMLESSKRITALESGWLGGHSPGVSDARQEFDQASAVLQKSVMDSMKGQGQMSQAKMSFIESLKPNSKMNAKVREKVAYTLLSFAKRSGERITFNAAATDAGFDPKQTKVLWKLYNNERPEYDSKNQRPIDNNLNTFSDYISKDALDAAIHGKSYSPKKQGEEPNNDMVMVVAQNGQKGMIPKGKLDEALKRGARVIQ